MKTKKLIILISVLFGLSMLITAGTSIYVFFATRSVPTEFNIQEPSTGEGTGYYRHCYEELLPDEQKMYSVILSAVYSMPEKIEVPSLEGGSFNKVFSALSYDNPDLFCMGTKSSLEQLDGKFYFVPEYTMTYEQFSAKLSEANKIASAISSTAVTYTSAYERELYIHDYLVNHCTYSLTNENKNDIYGCLVNGKASCEGYSRAFQYLLSAVGIDNRLVTGMATNTIGEYEGHMWNFLFLDDEGYFCDITWDDPSADGSILRHTYFNVTTAEILKKHKDIVQSLPFCTDKTYNFFAYENCYFDTAEENALKENLSNTVYAARNRGYRCAEMAFDSSETLKSAVEAMFDKNMIFDVYNNAGIVIKNEDEGIYYSTDEDAFTVCLYF